MWKFIAISCNHHIILHSHNKSCTFSKVCYHTSFRSKWRYCCSYFTSLCTASHVSITDCREQKSLSTLQWHNVLTKFLRLQPVVLKSKHVDSKTDRPDIISFLCVHFVYIVQRLCNEDPVHVCCSLLYTYWAESRIYKYIHNDWSWIYMKHGPCAWLNAYFAYLLASSFTLWLWKLMPYTWQS
jgi:hypothetical protein